MRPEQRSRTPTRPPINQHLCQSAKTAQREPLSPVEAELHSCVFQNLPRVGALDLNAFTKPSVNLSVAILRSTRSADRLVSNPLSANRPELSALLASNSIPLLTVATIC